MSGVGYTIVKSRRDLGAGARGLPSGRPIPRSAARREAQNQARQAQCRLSADDGRHSAHLGRGERHQAQRERGVLYGARPRSRPPRCRLWPAFSERQSVARGPARLPRTARRILRRARAAGATPGARLCPRARPASHILRWALHKLPVQLRATHYPSQTRAPGDEFGIAPHTDTSFLTLLAPNDVPGLAFRTQTGDWIDVPTVPDAFIVNGGQLLLRWTNDRFLATPHRAVNRTGGERYALAFFCDAQIDWPVAAVPTCMGPDN